MLSFLGKIVISESEPTLPRAGRPTVISHQSVVIRSVQRLLVL